MTFSPWQFTSPYIPYTKILAEQVNPNFNGISVSLKFVADELNQFIPRLPDGFAGNNKIPVGPYHNTLLGISQDGNMELVDRGAFALAVTKDLTVMQSTEQQITVDGNSHAVMYDMAYSGELSTIDVIVNEAVATVDGVPAYAPGSVIFFTQNSDAVLTFTPVDGVTIRSPGALRAFTRDSTVALLALTQNVWLLIGDIDPGEIVITDPPAWAFEAIANYEAGMLSPTFKMGFSPDGSGFTTAYDSGLDDFVPVPFTWLSGGSTSGYTLEIQFTEVAKYVSANGLNYPILRYLNDVAVPFGQFIPFDSLIEFYLDEQGYVPPSEGMTIGVTVRDANNPANSVSGQFYYGRLNIGLE